MINNINIKNYALISGINIDLAAGMTVVTGETGSGKSILLGALGLVAGQRADSQVLYDKSKKCIVEVNFGIAEYKLKNFFKKHELDYSDNTIIRREITPDGKSRAFINDTPVTLTILKELSESLIDIHSQHETLLLNEGNFQLSVVDAFAGHEKKIAEYNSGFNQFKKIEKELNELIEKEKQAKKETDYFQFQFNELEDANLRLDEQLKLEEEIQTLSNAEAIKQALTNAYKGLSGEEAGLLSSLRTIKSSLSSIEKFSSNIKELSERLKSSQIELNDIANELQNLEQDIVYDPKRIEEVNERLDTIYRLQNKHQVKDIGSLIAIKDSLSNKLIEFTSLEEQIVKLESEKKNMLETLTKSAKQISDSRKKNITDIEKDIETILLKLSMPNARIKIDQSISTDIHANGFDTILFTFSANKGNDFKGLNKVASGGELSRLMLSIKSLIAKQTALPTIVFDEIDTGVSGDVAAKVADIMVSMSKSIQVIAITHLPQIASRGVSHLRVYKKDEKERTITFVEKLDKDERITEIAKMLSSGKPSEAAIKNAKELLKV